MRVLLSECIYIYRNSYMAQTVITLFDRRGISSTGNSYPYLTRWGRERNFVCVKKKKEEKMLYKNTGWVAETTGSRDIRWNTR